MPIRFSSSARAQLDKCVVGGLAALATACSGAQSALDPAGRDAERIASLITWMTVGAIAIWAAVIGLAFVVTRARVLQSARAGAALIIGGGVAFPFVVLTVLLVFGLAELPAMLTPAAPGGVFIEITGSQWWWRVRYHPADGAGPIELANEIHLPVGRRTNTRLVSSDVVHSFWIPPLAGKMDMIPGRANYLALEPLRTGVFRGACAEYCGTSHARMNLISVVVGQPAFDQWLMAQRRPAVPPTDPAAVRGQAAFMRHGCSACHTVRGSAAAGVSGPDLTHVGSRQSLAAGTLPNEPDALARWIVGTQLLKPGAHMPAFADLPAATTQDLVAYLRHLQ